MISIALQVKAKTPVFADGETPLSMALTWSV